MRTALTFLFVIFSAFAQNHTPSTSPIPSCGPSEQDFDVKLDKASHAVNQPQPGRALIYVIEVFQVPRKFLAGSPTIRIGLDGFWMGANRGIPTCLSPWLPANTISAASGNPRSLTVPHSTPSLVFPRRPARRISSAHKLTGNSIPRSRRFGPSIYSRSMQTKENIWLLPTH